MGFGLDFQSDRVCGVLDWAKEKWRMGLNLDFSVSVRLDWVKLGPLKFRVELVDLTRFIFSPQTVG